MNCDLVSSLKLGHLLGSYPTTGARTPIHSSSAILKMLDSIVIIHSTTVKYRGRDLSSRTIYNKVLSKVRSIGSQIPGYKLQFRANIIAIVFAGHEI